jgi:hypothetical protein
MGFLSYIFFTSTGLPVIMFAAYVVGIQYQNLKLWMPLRVFATAVVVFITLPLDVFLNWTLFSLYLFQFPKVTPDVPKSEWTFSDRVNRQCLEDTMRGRICLVIGRVLNFFCPSHDHIPNAVGR